MADPNVTDWTPPVTPGDPQTGGNIDLSWLQFLNPLQSTTEWFPGVRTNWPELARSLQRGWEQATYVSPEDQLTSAIAQKMGVNNASDRRHVYLINAMARQSAHQTMEDPTTRQEVATWLGWNMKNPHVAYWVQHGTNYPSDPTGTGVTPGTAVAAGTQPGGTTAAAAGSIAAPFDRSKWVGRSKDPGFTYGALLPPDIARAAGVDRQWGVDYALPEGSALNSPFSGRIIEAGWNGPYGNTVVVRMANGVTYRVAHLSQMNVKVGDNVPVGGVLGAVGNTGNSFGPHVLIEMRDPQGKPIDPTPIIDQLLQPGADLSATGPAFTKLNDLNGMIANQAGPFLTPDGHWIYPGSQDYNVYAAAQSLYKKRYGGDPPWTFVSGLIASGATTAEQIQAQMDAMSSDISGMNWGTRDTFANSAQGAAAKLWNRNVPDATLKQLATLGITQPQQIQDWFGSHPAAALDAKTYGAYFDAANPHTQDVWQQPPSPDLIAEIHKKMEAGPA